MLLHDASDDPIYTNEGSKRVIPHEDVYVLGP